MTHRLVPSKFPVIGLYDTVAQAEDLDATMEIEARTNARVQHEYQTLMRLPRAEWVVGPGSTPVMAAICNPNPSGSRFADSSFGAYYAGGSIETAQLETIFHTERMLRGSVDGVAPGVLVRRAYQCRIGVPLAQITAASHRHLLDPDVGTYGQSQGFARALRDGGAAGIHYPSVRDPGGFCVAIFRPTAVVLPVVASAHYQFHWDGRRITHVSEIGSTAAVVAN